MTQIHTIRVIGLILSGVVSPVILTQCKTTSGTYKDVSYDPSKLKTPAGHGLEKKEYPFDESGVYRKDWVKSNASGRDRSAVPSTESSTQLASVSTMEGGSTGPNGYPTYAEASAARASGNFVGPAGESYPGSTEPAGEMVTASASGGAATTPRPAASPSYHKVSSGDTLFALAGRYNTSVTELKRMNGLKGDSIRVGQSLRIP